MRQHIRIFHSARDRTGGTPPAPAVDAPESELGAMRAPDPEITRATVKIGRLWGRTVVLQVSGAGRAIPYGIVVLCALAAAAITTTVALPVDAPTRLRLQVFGWSGGVVLLVGVAVVLVRGQRPRTQCPAAQRPTRDRRRP